MLYKDALEIFTEYIASTKSEAFKKYFNMLILDMKKELKYIIEVKHVLTMDLTDIVKFNSYRLQRYYNKPEVDYKKEINKTFTRYINFVQHSNNNYLCTQNESGEYIRYLTKFTYRFFHYEQVTKRQVTMLKNILESLTNLDYLEMNRDLFNEWIDALTYHLYSTNDEALNNSRKFYHQVAKVFFEFFEEPDLSKTITLEDLFKYELLKKKERNK